MDRTIAKVLLIQKITEKNANVVSPSRINCLVSMYCWFDTVRGPDGYSTRISSRNYVMLNTFGNKP
jgi:hypothetical protein